MINALFYLNKLSAPKSLTNFDFYQHELTVGHEQIKKFSWTWTSSWVLTDKSNKGQGQRVKDHESCIDTGIYMASWENCILVLLVSYCLRQQQVGVSAPWPTILMTFSILMQVVDLTQVWPDGLFEYISPKMQVEQHLRMKMSSELLLWTKLQNSPRRSSSGLSRSATQLCLGRHAVNISIMKII